MQQLAIIDVLSAGRTADFRPQDNYSIGDGRRCLVIVGGESAQFAFQLDAVPAGAAEVVIAGCLEVYDSHAYVYKHLNTVFEVRVNGVPVFDGIQHWRSHEETVAFWNPFDYPFDAALLKPGMNTVTLFNKTGREALGEFYDVQLDAVFGAEEAERKLSTLYLSTVEVNHVASPIQYPALRGVPRTAVAGVPFIVEVSTGPRAAPVAIGEADNATVTDLGAQEELGEYRALFEITLREAGKPCAVSFTVNDTTLTARVETVYARQGTLDLVLGPGAESTYWHQLLVAAQDFFALDSGTCFRVSIDDFLGNLHFYDLAQWKPLIEYLVRRRRHYALQRLRVPPYSRIQHHELTELADLGPGLFAGTSVPEPILFLHREHAESPDLDRRLGAYLDYFVKRMEEVRLPGHPVVTFDSPGALSGHYYRLGLDAQVSEIGPACNVVEEICSRGAATAYGKPWGVATAMHWYCGQGAHYACDDSRVRQAWLTMLSSYLAGARHIVWEGGVFDNLPVYNYLLTEESWRDYGRRYHHPALVAMRDNFRRLLDLHRAQQLPSPTVRFAVLHGNNDMFTGAFQPITSTLGDMSMIRAWSLLKVWLPHFSWGRHGADHGRPHRRWYSCTPYGQVDVIPEHASLAHYQKYGLLALLGWNTMTDEQYDKLLHYVEKGGTLFAALPHFVTDTRQRHLWTFYRGGDLTQLCGVRARDMGRRLETVRFHTEQFAAHLPAEMTLSPKNPLFVEDFDETYPVFSLDVTYVTGDVEVTDAEVLATSQAGQPVLLRKRIGNGAVYLLNTYHHAGRGRLLDLAEGILRTLVEEQPAPLRLHDPRQVVAWFEYPADGFTRHVFLNTDWTTEGNTAPVTVTFGEETIRFDVPEGKPVQLLSDGQRHRLVTDPVMQVTGWNADGETLHLSSIGDAGAVHRIGRCDGH